MAYQQPQKTSFARQLRKTETSAEIKLWEQLRGRRLDGLKFVRQLPVGSYIVDFACRSEKLVVEVDGATHGDAHEVAHDLRRSAFLEQEGWKVIRVENEGVYKNMSWLCDAILRAVGR